MTTRFLASFVSANATGLVTSRKKVVILKGSWLRLQPRVRELLS